MARGKGNESPMLIQYREGKTAHPDALLLMRMGDFYEAFFEDAQELARITGVMLTSRNKDDPDPVPMAGVPHHQLDNYLTKLLSAGKRVAVMDQLESPEQAKGIVRRGVTRVVSAGTLVDEQVLSASANHLVALSGISGRVGIAALDISTGRFTCEIADGASEIALALARLHPVELLIPEDLRHDPEVMTVLSTLVQPVPPLATLPPFAWRGDTGRTFLCERMRVAALDGFGIAAAESGDVDALAIGAAAAALRYALGSVRAGEGDGRLGHVRSLTRLRHERHLILDAVCRRNLELTGNLRNGGRDGTLLDAIDRTRSAPGARLLAQWLTQPLADLTGITERHDAIAALVADDRQRDHVREALGNVYDLERLLARIGSGRSSARDLVQLGATLTAAERCAATLPGTWPSILHDALLALAPAPGLAKRIATTLVDDPAPAAGDGQVRDGVDAEIDAVRAAKRDADAWLAEYQAREAAACNLPRLKVGYNSVFGYYIELSKARGEQAAPHFIRKQTLVNAERFITPELKAFEERILSADDRLRAAETRIVVALREAAESALPAIQACAHALAAIDVLAALAHLARRGGWCRPTMDVSGMLDLRGARHPVVEHVIGHGRFIANDTQLVAEGTPRMAVLTGPNMAGKSTYIRQVALAVILAQAGAFVPADAAHIGLVDRVFTRVGAGDELARNLSTFMVEMSETAAILNHATARSLVVLDEVGRGTSTFDGVSLAWAICEHLHDRIGCRALFATHYHELTDLATDRPGIANLTVAVEEQADDVVFLHRIVAGAAGKSYGIHVARIAGIPPSVIARAKSVLGTLESLNTTLTERESHAPGQPSSSAVQLTLWQPIDHPVVAQLRSLDIDALSPRQALDLLDQLRKAVR